MVHAVALYKRPRKAQSSLHLRLLKMSSLKAMVFAGGKLTQGRCGLTENGLMGRQGVGSFERVRAHVRACGLFGIGVALLKEVCHWVGSEVSGAQAQWFSFC